MEKPKIGIRQADGSFYEIMGDTQSGHKRLVLSAARSDQHGVRIELFRSLDGQADPDGALGSISLDDPQGLGYQDIEFRVDLDAEGQLAASATLPGQAPRTLSVDLTPFRTSSDPLETPGDPLLADLDLDSEPMTLDLPDALEEDQAPRRSDTDILADETFALADLDTLDDSFTTEPEPGAAPSELSFDLPEEDAPRRSDSDILGDEAFASADLDTLDDFSFEDAEEGTPETRGLDALDQPETFGPADSFDLPEAAGDFSPGSFDLGDLDAGFGDDPVAANEPAGEAGGGNPAEEWEKISLDDMEPMEFLDTGAEISAPSKSASKKPEADSDSFRMDDDEPLELGDFDSDLSDLPDLGDMGDSSPSFPAPDTDNDLDMDFLAPPALTEPSPWDSEMPGDEPAPAKEKGKKKDTATKEPKAEKVAKAAPAPGPRGGDSSIDKMALMLSLAALSLLVLLILVLLFLNMIKAPQPPVIQPEVQRWKTTSSLASAQAPRVDSLDLGAADPVVLEAQSVLEVPPSLKTARVSLVLEPGETVEDVSRRFGDPARVQGNQLSW